MVVKWGWCEEEEEEEEEEEGSIGASPHCGW